MSLYVADFETTTLIDNCHVWAYAICEVKNPNKVIIGTTIEEFMEWCEKQEENNIIYFHNLKFDSQFIMQYLFTHGYTCTEELKDRKSKTFNTLISDKGLYYQVEVIFKIKGKHTKKVTFRDSLKLIPLSVDAIAKAFKLPISKLEIDYDLHNNLPVGSPISDKEKEYIKHDVQIVAYAIDYFIKQGLDKMTIGSCALNEYKNIIDKKNFSKFFPTPTYHDDVKPSYRGGFTWLNPKFKGKTVKNGIVLDVNSLYPSCMAENYLPYGKPLFFTDNIKKTLYRYRPRQKLLFLQRYILFLPKVP